MKKTALITGITGQDGFYLTKLLLSKRYKVVGLVKKIDPNAPTISHFKDKVEYIVGDLNDADSVPKAIQTVRPHEVYNLASQSYPAESWGRGLETLKVNGMGAHLLYDAVKELGQECRVFQASSSEMFGETTKTPQNELTPFNPVNPYAVAKLYAHQMAKVYRQSYGMFISCGILFNHESPKRGMRFITQKISYAAACLKLGILTSPLLNEQGEPIVKNGIVSLGNLEAKRDWGFAGDYVKAMWLMLQQNEPDDYVIGTGEIRTIEELCQAAFSYVGLDWKDYVRVDSRFIRPTETNATVADTSKAQEKLGWRPSVSFKELISKMIDIHLENLAVVSLS